MEDDEECRSHLTYIDNGDGTTGFTIHLHETKETYSGIIEMPFQEMIETMGKIEASMPNEVTDDMMSKTTIIPNEVR